MLPFRLLAVSERFDLFFAKSHLNYGPEKERFFVAEHCGENFVHEIVELISLIIIMNEFK